jgi:hypothetical protein
MEEPPDGFSGEGCWHPKLEQQEAKARIRKKDNLSIEN